MTLKYVMPGGQGGNKNLNRILHARKYAQLIFIGLIHFIDLIQSLPIQHNFDVTLENEYIDLGEIDTGDEEPTVYIFKRMVDQVAKEMNGEVVSTVGYQYPGVDFQQTTMIVDGKPLVMGSYAVTDDNGYNIMTVYVAGKDGYKPITKVRFQALPQKERNKQQLLKSLVGGK